LVTPLGGNQMPLLNEIEAAMRMGISVDLLRYFTKHCPKQKESRLLRTKILGTERHYEQSEVEDYRRYLAKPWPHEEGKRPSIPDPIKQDIKAESHFWCAICGNQNQNEVAHIEAVADSLNNSPENLIYLCSNHHTAYDLGFKPKNNVDLDAIRAAKRVKRDSRLRMMRFEANTVKLLQSFIATLEQLEKEIVKAKSADHVSMLQTETKLLLSAHPKLVKEAEEAAAKDTEFTGVGKAVTRFAPNIGKHILGISTQSNEVQVRAAAKGVVESANAALATLDEVECPHCGGSGLYGLVGDLCGFCSGDQVVTHEKADSYNPDELDETDCPRCFGRGMTGLVGDACAFCKGSCVVSREEAKSYKESDIDEVLCPHCGGRGMTGLANDLCTYCGGSQYVSKKEAEEYSAEDIDEVDCPHCRGKGLQGLSSYYCAFCKGSQTISREKAKSYDADAIDEVDCPHCRGRGLIGLNGLICTYCEGAGVVSAVESAAYEPDSIDEVDCPRCGGKGTIGFRGTQCGLCKGDGVVSRETDTAFRSKHRE